MTLLITMCTKNGIFMIADSLEVEEVNGKDEPSRIIDKIKKFKEINVILSFWGTTKNLSNNFDLIKSLNEFEKRLNDADNVLTVSNKIKIFFEELKVLENDDNLGFHICGYIGDEGHFHHVHHTTNLDKNQFINEDCKKEYNRQKKYLEYPIIFNGDNIIPNIFINIISYFNDKIEYKTFDSKKAREFLLFLMDTAIKLQNFSSRSLTFGKLIDYPFLFYEIYKNEIKNEKINGYRGREK